MDPSTPLQSAIPSVAGAQPSQVSLPLLVNLVVGPANPLRTLKIRKLILEPK